MGQLQKGHRHLGPLLKITDIYGTDFIKTELRLGLTFSRLALQSKDAGKASRNVAKAQKAHDTELRHYRKAGLSEENGTEIRNLLAQLEANLALLR